MVSCIHLFQLQQDELKGKLDVYYLREEKIADPDMWTRETAKFIPTFFFFWIMKLCFLAPQIQVINS